MSDAITIGWPQAIYLGLNLVGMALLRDGQPIRRTSILVTWCFITLPLLWWGGFF